MFFNFTLRISLTMKQVTIIIYFLIFQSAMTKAQENPEFLKHINDQWVDSLMQKLTLEQKIGQLFMVQAYSNEKNQCTDEVLTLINQFQVGGVIFMQGGPVAQAKICNKLQEASNIPLLMAIDAESGLSFRLDSTLNYPFQMALGAIAEDSLIYRMGYEIGEQCRLVGIHMNMAPVCDINVNPENPVINYRSFGEDKLKVAWKSWLYTKGMMDAGIIATAKHFPGHGDTQTDSHLNMPIINQTKNQLDSLEIYPFAYLINRGISAVMTAHLQVPALEPDSKIPATLSSGVIQNKLKKDLGFKGLIITDAMNMKGVSNLYSSAQSTVKALKAGNDMLEIVPKLDKAIDAVKLAVNSGELSLDEIDEKCRKILAIKKWLGLDHRKSIETTNLYQKLNSSKYELTKRLLQEKSLTVLENKQNIIPIQRLDTLRIASLMIGSEQKEPFQEMIGNYTNIDHFNVSKTPSDAEIKSLLNQLSSYNLLIVGITGLKLYPSRQYSISDQQIKLVEKLKGLNTIICFFGNPYAMKYFNSLEESRSLIVAYKDDKDAQELTAQLIFGATSATGRLPVSINKQYQFNSGINVNSIKRLKYTLPEEVNISSEYLNSKIDSIAELGISKKAFPGCQVLIAKEGKIILNKSYGYFTYEKENPVQNDDLYDLASITKVSAALPVIMKLYDEKRINLDQPFANYFSEFKNTNKSAITFRDILTHQARLQGSIPFWLEPGKSTKLRTGVFQSQPSDKYQIRVSSGIYERNDFKNQIFTDIAKSPLWNQKEFHYSDLGFSLIPTVSERLTGKAFQDYLNHELYKPLGLVSTCFNPNERIPIDQVVPTENDLTFRKEQLQGYVHDELSAMLGGISGNAGLFSTANDLAKIMQMYLQSGFYGGKQFISTATMNEFTKVQFPLTRNRRALGFDKPNPGIIGLKNKFPATDASPESYGHTGFTGTFTWVDPKNQLLFIFLSNRVYPTRRNTEIYDLNIRTNMHQVIYDAIKKGLD